MKKNCFLPFILYALLSFVLIYPSVAKQTDDAKQSGPYTVNNQGCIGLFIRNNRVFHVVSNSPAAKAGIKTGDKILTIDGIPTEKMKSKDLLQELQGSVGTSVNLCVSHHGKERTLSLTRAEPSKFFAKIQKKQSLRLNKQSAKNP
jgi:C-terminal processing protease CtpA/Prc